jgi:hypothetical protein
MVQPIHEHCILWLPLLVLLLLLVLLCHCPLNTFHPPSGLSASVEDAPLHAAAGGGTSMPLSVAGMPLLSLLLLLLLLLLGRIRSSLDLTASVWIVCLCEDATQHFVACCIQLPV